MASRGSFSTLDDVTALLTPVLSLLLARARPAPIHRECPQGPAASAGSWLVPDGYARRRGQAASMEEEIDMIQMAMTLSLSESDR